MSNKVQRGAFERAKAALHSISKWIHAQFEFSDSSLADEIIESMRAIRETDRKNREPTKA